MPAMCAFVSIKYVSAPAYVAARRGGDENVPGFGQFDAIFAKGLDKLAKIVYI
jgi:hypothetical protein